MEETHRRSNVKSNSAELDDDGKTAAPKCDEVEVKRRRGAIKEAPKRDERQRRRSAIRTAPKRDELQLFSLRFDANPDFSV